MNVIYPPGSRSYPTDRNYSTKGSVYDANAVAPHALTTRFTYTVPASKKAIIGSGTVHFFRDGTSGGAARMQAQLTVTTADATVAACTRLEDSTAAFAVTNNAPTPGQMTLIAADIVRAQTFDLSVGGTYSYLISIAVGEYDA